MQEPLYDQVAAHAEIRMTNDYDKFLLLDGNRPRSNKHSQNLILSYEENEELAVARPVIVNEEYRIIDGQHRIPARKALGRPVYYMKIPGTSIKSAQALNVSQKNWSLDDYLKSFIAERMPSYLRFNDLQEEYGLATTPLIVFCQGTQMRRNSDSFKKGNFKILVEEETLIERLDWLRALAPHVKFWNEQSFAMAFHNVLRNPDFSPGRLVKKLESGARIERQANVREYMREIERAYNYNVKSDSAIVRLF